MIKKIVYVLVIAVLAFGFYKLLSIPPKTNNSSNETPTSTSTITSTDKNYDNPDFILFYGNTCPHCQKVEAWINDNKADEKLKINKKEVYQNTDNQKELATIVSQYCPDLNNNGIGVPLGIDTANKKCIQGDAPIIDFLSQKVK
jgi:thiol-disulfide isomerase/thioredoxin